MFYDLKEKIINFILSRFSLLFLSLIIITAILVNRIFQLQIVNGDQYMSNFTLSIEKTVDIPSTRGNIYDCNGVLLAYNELAYSVTITDTIESGTGKNATLNTIIYNMIHMIEDSGDEIISDFKIYLDENGNFRYAVEGNTLLRFLADVYGRKTIQDLTYPERTATPDDVITYLAGEKKFGIGGYFTDEEGKQTAFVMGMGYTNEEILKIINIRYNLSLNAFQKYISTEVARDVSEKTVAVIMENSDILQGVAIEEETIRRYNNSIYFAPIIGYTGRISQEEYDSLSLDNPNYSLTDIVGKTGIEYSMENELQGTKGSETVYVDKFGRIIEVQNAIPPIAGNDIYLTIDSELQIAIYNLVEQKIAGILVSRIVNEKEVEQTGRNVQIPIYDVYYALFNNNVIDINHLSKEYAGETEKAVYQAFLNKQESVFAELRRQMMESDTAYRDLSKEYQVYESFIISMLSSNDYGVLNMEAVDQTDAVYQRWKTEESISIREFLTYAISKNWIDISKLHLESQYSDSSEIYAAM
ncbi:MAG: penicillin-binding protein, partial [Lachnospiraceae bacterium]|nr:penicillin-binding protein [Lachnospiraceae bacterium]